MITNGGPSDAWLTTDRLGDAQQAAADREVDAWEEFCAWSLGLCEFYQVPIHACEEGHEDHHIFVAYEELVKLIRARDQAVQAEEDERWYQAQLAAEREAGLP